MRYCKKFNILSTTTICLACEHCLPPNKRNDGRMCKNEVTHENKAEALILYCKLLKYLRTSTANIVDFKETYNNLIKDRYVPYVTKCAWTNKLCFGLDDSPVYGYRIAVEFDTLKDVKL